MHRSVPASTWKIGSEEEAVGRYDRRHCGKRRFVRTKSSLVVKALEVFYDLVRRRRAAHVMRKGSDTCGKEWCTPSQMCEDDVHVREASFLSADH